MITETELRLMAALAISETTITTAAVARYLIRISAI
jgi:hypothetical protein